MPRIEDPLPIDAESVVISLEEEFVRTHGLKELQPNALRINSNAAILHSRALNSRRYIWDYYENGPLMSKHFSPFAQTGHTFTVDYGYTYTRLAAWDLDCICRHPNFKDQNICLTDSYIGTIVMLMKERLKEFFNREERVNVEIKIWKHACGYHLYTNLNVSLPLHLIMTECFRNLTANHKFVIDLPSNMPLPYSAKRLGEVYEPYNEHNDQNLILVGFPVYYECCRVYNDSSQGSDDTDDPSVIMTYNSIGQHHQKKTLNYTPSKIFQTSLCCIAGPLENCTLRNNFSSYMRPLMEWIQNMYSISPSLEDIRIKNSSILSLMKFHGISNYLITKITSFLGDFFAALYNSQIPVTYSWYTILSTEYGCMYLQPYVVLLYKNLMTDENTFREILMCLYISVIDIRQVSVFIRNCTKNTYNPYMSLDTKHMQKIIIMYKQFGITPNMSILDIIPKILAFRLGLTSNIENDSPSYVYSAAIFEYIRQLSITKTYKVRFRDFLDKYLELIVELDCVIKTQAAKCKYIYILTTNGSFSQGDSQISILDFPKMSEWIASENKLIKFSDNIIKYHENFDRDILWTPNVNYMYNTKMGVFNVETGLYTAHMPFLRFPSYRNFALWRYENLSITKAHVNFSTLNDEILEDLDVVRRFADAVHDRTTEAYIYYQIIPSILKLRYENGIRDDHIQTVMTSLGTIHNLDGYTKELRFLIDVYPFEPAFIHILMHIYTVHQSALFKPKLLVSRVFMHRQKTVTKNDWMEIFRDIYKDFTYTIDEKSHIDTLKSIKSKHIGTSTITEHFLIYMTIIGACLVKCNSYTEFMKAFLNANNASNEIRLPDARYVHPIFGTGSQYRMTIESQKERLWITQMAMFGELKSAFEMRLFQLYMCMNMSLNFNPSITSEFYNVVSVSMVPYNVNKKMFLFHGRKGAGKSHASKLLEFMHRPNTLPLQSIEEAIARIGANAKFALLIVSEIKDVKPDQIKGITGNDATSSKVFHTQGYEVFTSQCHIFGATNGILNFKNTHDVDETSVDRLHAIKFDGRHALEVMASSMLGQVASAEFSLGVISSSTEEQGNTLAWLAFSSYLRTRDKNNIPKLNNNCSSVLEYRESVYRANNSLYEFLSRCGLRFCPNMITDKIHLKNILHNGFKNNTTSKIKDFNEACYMYNQQFKINLHDSTISHVPGIIETKLYHHIQTNFEVEYFLGSYITRDQLEERCEIYVDMTERANAEEYFQTNHVYDAETERYNNIRFVRPPVPYISRKLIMDILDDGNNTIVND